MPVTGCGHILTEDVSTDNVESWFYPVLRLEDRPVSQSHKAVSCIVPATSVLILVDDLDVLAPTADSTGFVGAVETHFTVLGFSEHVEAFEEFGKLCLDCLAYVYGRFFQFSHWQTPWFRFTEHTEKVVDQPPVGNRFWKSCGIRSAPWVDDQGSNASGIVDP